MLHFLAYMPFLAHQFCRQRRRARIIADDTGRHMWMEQAFASRAGLALNPHHRCLNCQAPGAIALNRTHRTTNTAILKPSFIVLEGSLS